MSTKVHRVGRQSRTARKYSNAPAQRHTEAVATHHLIGHNGQNRGSPQTVEPSVVVIMAGAGWSCCARVRRGQAGACPLFLLAGAAGVPGVRGGPQGRRAQARCAAPLRPGGRPRTLSGRSKASGGVAASFVRPAQRARRAHAASFPARASS